jgi:Leucine-rich repeat (LRR) protein
MPPELVKMRPNPQFDGSKAYMTTPYSPVGYYCAGIVLVCLGGCARYQVTLNEQPIYTPPPLYSQFEVADEALKNCLRQTIADQNITQAEQLTQLVCRHAGIRSLQGLEKFTALEALDLSYNALRDLTPLQNLGKLKLLRINNNPDLQCDTLPGARPDLSITTASHCSQ